MYCWHMASFRFVFLLFISLLVVNSSFAAPPNCAKAVASPNNLWPPNHKFEEIAVNGVTDPDRDATRIVINCIMQDEPLNKTGDGNTQYDGYGLGESRAHVRSERSGNLNARFYHISFSAFDTHNESCTGEVLVSVAHNPPRPPIDGGPLYQSTQQQGTGCGGPPPLNHPPIITSQPVLTVVAGTPYRYDVDAVDADGDTLTYSLLTFPNNMSIDSLTGLINWQPTTANIGNVQVKVQVSDGKGGSAQQAFTINVLPPQNNPPIITSQPVVTVQAGTPYNYDVDAVDADGDVLSYSLLTGPGTMSINSVTGLISWQPTNLDVGNVQVKVQVSDGKGGSAQQAFTVAVTPVIVPQNHPPTITSTPVLTVVAGTPYSYDVEAFDADGDVLSYSLLTAPSNMHIDSLTGLISWQPTNGDIGNVQVDVLVSDGNGGSAEQTFTIAVLPVPQNHPPIITSTPVLTVEAGSPYSYDVEAFDADGDVLSYSLLTAPGSMTIDSATGLISWQPGDSDVGNVQVNVLVSDGKSGSAEQTFTITVTPFIVPPS